MTDAAGPMWDMEDVAAEFEHGQRAFGVLTAFADPGNNAELKSIALAEAVRSYTDVGKLIRALVHVAYLGYDRAASLSGKTALEEIQGAAATVALIADQARRHVEETARGDDEE